MTDSLAGTLHYHRVTKHAPGRYARSAGMMDWDNQPNPFRLYSDGPAQPLPLGNPDPSGGHLALFRPDPLHSRPFDLASIGKLFELSLGLSAWKGTGNSRWALRMNPSSGNLHPTEAHVFSALGSSLEACAAHYCPLSHALEYRATVPGDLWRQLRECCGSDDGLLVVLTSIHWRESWKYGERAFRYCMLDLGHALAGMAMAANLLGWRLTCIGGLAPAPLARMLGFDRIPWPPGEAERPELACRIATASGKSTLATLPDALLDRLAALAWGGQPNRLSPSLLDWEIIARTADLTAGPQATAGELATRHGPLLEEALSPLDAADIVRHRRSATAFDRRHLITLAQFRALLDKTLPRAGLAPFDIGLPPPSIDLALFVHRVEGLAAGLYFLLRGDQGPEFMAGQMAPDFTWHKTDETLPLFCLRRGDLRPTATHLSCDQAIAGDSAFSLGMLADFDTLRREGAAAYRRLFWEGGMVGQVLYLEAEAQGLRATGIGCFFDDAVHRLLGLRSERFQSIYHLTIGRPLEDQRISIQPPYGEVAQLRRRLYGRGLMED